jgi:hypothetical protein
MHMHAYIHTYACSRLSHREFRPPQTRKRPQAAARYFISRKSPKPPVFFHRSLDWHFACCSPLFRLLSHLCWRNSSRAICSPMVLWPPPAYSATKGIWSKLSNSYEHPSVCSIALQNCVWNCVSNYSVGQGFWRNRSHFSWISALTFVAYVAPGTRLNRK